MFICRLAGTVYKFVTASVHIRNIAVVTNNDEG